MANLGPEDNAAWIHAASGFLRYNATVTQASNFQYGVNGFLSTQLSIFTSVSKWGSELREIQLVFVSVFNTYIFSILIASFFTASACVVVFSNIIELRTAKDQAKLGLFGLLGIPTTVVLGILMSTYGHLSLIVAIMMIWITFWIFFEFSDSNLRDPQNTKSKIFQILSQLIMVLMIGTIWFPLIPISYILMALIISYSAYREFKTRFGRNLVYDRRRISIRSVAFMALFSILVLLIALVTLKLLRFPSGYSAGSLINAAGGTYQISSLVLAFSLVGLLFSLNSVEKFSLQSILVILLATELAAVWILSLSENPNSPGYSVQKFAVLIAAIGVPLIISVITSYLLALARNFFFLISVPVITTFAMTQISFPINSFPRSDVMEFSRSGIANYQVDLIKLTSGNKNSQILCLSNQTELAIYAYLCSRFASALQFKEHGDGELARRWRSQILERSVDPNLNTTGSDFGVSIAVRDYLDQGGSLVINLIPGPLGSFQAQTEPPWIKTLPWHELAVHWQTNTAR